MIVAARDRSAVQREGGADRALDVASLRIVNERHRRRWHRRRSQGSRHTRPPPSSARRRGSGLGHRPSGSRPPSAARPTRAARRGSGRTTRPRARPQPPRTPPAPLAPSSIASSRRPSSQSTHGLVEGNHGDVPARIAERLTSVRKVVERDPSIAGLGPEHAQVVVADARVAALVGLGEQLTRALEQRHDVAVAAERVQHRGELLLAGGQLGGIALTVEQLAAGGGEPLAGIERPARARGAAAPRDGRRGSRPASRPTRRTPSAPRRSRRAPRWVAGGLAG